MDVLLCRRRGGWSHRGGCRAASWRRSTPRGGRRETGWRRSPTAGIAPTGRRNWRRRGKRRRRAPTCTSREARCGRARGRRTPPGAWRARLPPPSPFSSPFPRVLFVARGGEVLYSSVRSLPDLFSSSTEAES